MLKKFEKGFTLVEVIITSVIIVFISAAILYLILTFTIVWFFERLEKKMSVRDARSRGNCWQSYTKNNSD